MTLKWEPLPHPVAVRQTTPEPQTGVSAIPAVGDQAGAGEGSQSCRGLSLARPQLSHLQMGLKRDLSHSPTQGVVLGKLSAEQVLSGTTVISNQLDGRHWKEPRDNLPLPAAGLWGAPGCGMGGSIGLDTLGSCLPCTATCWSPLTCCVPSSGLSRDARTARSPGQGTRHRSGPERKWIF